MSRDDARPGPTREIEMVGERGEYARRPSVAVRTVPQFCGFDEVDMTACEDLRARLNAKWAAARGELTAPTFVIRAIVVALRDHPAMNARHDDARGIVVQHESVDIGVSLGASAPMLRNAGSLTLWECEAEMRALAAGAAAALLDAHELREPTITIASLGEFGGLAMFPVIAAGEVAIIGVNRLEIRPSWREDRFAPRKMMNLTGSFDQRVIPPREAGRFIAAIKQLLESPAELFIEP